MDGGQFVFIFENIKYIEKNFFLSVFHSFFCNFDFIEVTCTRK